MENVLEETARKTLENAAEYDFEFELVLDENGRPIGCCTPVELLDELDSKFVATFGEEGRRMANARRERWNRKGSHHYKLF
ncbi:MAG: hypothetical protein LBC98_08685 [Prevotellaceae bacterium]|jgi:hypothetical protein|nr:hypothetical protein [Prevotellaceae bacterium]